MREPKRFFFNLDNRSMDRLNHRETFSHSLTHFFMANDTTSALGLYWHYVGAVFSVLQLPLIVATLPMWVSGSTRQFRSRLVCHTPMMYAVSY